MLTPNTSSGFHWSHGGLECPRVQRQSRPAVTSAVIRSPRRKAFSPDISPLDFILSTFTVGGGHIYDGTVNCLPCLILKESQISSKSPAKATGSCTPQHVLLPLSEMRCSYVILPVLSLSVWRLLEFRGDSGLPLAEKKHSLSDLAYLEGAEPSLDFMSVLATCLDVGQFGSYVNCSVHCCSQETHKELLREGRTDLFWLTIYLGAAVMAARARSHMAPAILERRDLTLVLSSLSPLDSVWNHSPWMVLPAFRVGPTSLGRPPWKPFHVYSKRCVTIGYSKSHQIDDADTPSQTLGQL